MTSAVTIYHIPQSVIVNGVSKDRHCGINIIDTPGFGDTRGPSFDNKIYSMIENVLKSLFTLDYIMLVVKSTDNRLGEAQKFTRGNEVSTLEGAS